MKHSRPNLLALLVLAISLGTFAASSIGRTAEINLNEEGHEQNRVSKNQIQAISVSQDAEGVTQEQFDIHFLKAFEKYILRLVKVKSEESLISLGMPRLEFDFTSDSAYAQHGTFKLAVIRLKIQGAGNQVHISGIDGSELKRVTCITASETTIPISGDTCGEKIQEVFGPAL